MQGIWKSHLDKNTYYKDCKIKKNKFKYLKKDKFFYYNKPYDKLSKNAKNNLTGKISLELMPNGHYTVLIKPHYYNKRLYSSLKYYGILVGSPVRKYYQKQSSSCKRRAIKKWIKVSDWETEVGTNKLSKSIFRMCY